MNSKDEDLRSIFNVLAMEFKVSLTKVIKKFINISPISKKNLSEDERNRTKGTKKQIMLASNNSRNTHLENYSDKLKKKINPEITK